jgi:hypothetical protein
MARAAAELDYVVGPKGERLTLDTLPPPSTSRWTVHRKAQVVVAVQRGLLTIDQACERYAITLEEYAAWERIFERFGLAGLRATQLQEYRNQLRS